MKRLLTLLLACALLAGCGGGDDSSSPSTGASGASGASGAQGAATTTTDSTAADPGDAAAGGEGGASGSDSGEEAAGALSPADESEIEDTAKTWLTQGGCDLMTDRLLTQQTHESDRDIACKTFETIFTPPAASADQITVTKITGDGASASAKIGDTLGTGVTSVYRFKKVAGSWQIDKASL